MRRGRTKDRYKTQVCGTHSTDFLHYQRYAGQVAASQDCMVFGAIRGTRDDAASSKLAGHGTNDAGLV